MGSMKAVCRAIPKGKEVPGHKDDDTHSSSVPFTLPGLLLRSLYKEDNRQCNVYTASSAQLLLSYSSPQKLFPPDLPFPRLNTQLYITPVSTHPQRVLIITHHPPFCAAAAAPTPAAAPFWPALAAACPLAAAPAGPSGRRPWQPAASPQPSAGKQQQWQQKEQPKKRSRCAKGEWRRAASASEAVPHLNVLHASSNSSMGKFRSSDLKNMLNCGAVGTRWVLCKSRTDYLAGSVCDQSKKWLGERLNKCALQQVCTGLGVAEGSRFI
eukprot:1161947-Pelagomonas_calceolata.AAC.4